MFRQARNFVGQAAAGLLTVSFLAAFFIGKASAALGAWLIMCTMITGLLGAIALTAYGFFHLEYLRSMKPDKQ